MNHFIDMIFELLLDGAIEATGFKGIPTPVRILLAVSIMAFVFGVCGLLIYVGLGTGNVILQILGTALIAVFIVILAQKMKQRMK